MKPHGRKVEPSRYKPGDKIIDVVVHAVIGRHERRVGEVRKRNCWLRSVAQQEPYTEGPSLHAAILLREIAMLDEQFKDLVLTWVTQLEDMPGEAEL